MFYAPFDSETGGFNPERVDLLTFYMAIIDENLKLVDEIYLKLKPDDGRIPVAEAQALEVNGIDLRQHMEDPETVTYSEGRTRLVGMLRKYHKKEGRFNNIRPMGYNVPFDEGFAWKYLMSKEEWLEWFHYKRVDVMERVDGLKEAGWLPQDLGSLVTVNDFFQLPRRKAHNAKEDTLMCVDVYKAWLNLMKSKKDGAVQQDLISLLEAE